MPAPLERARDLGGRSALDFNVLATADRGDRTLWALNMNFFGLELHYFLGPSGSCLGSPLRGQLLGLKTWRPKTLGANQDF